MSDLALLSALATIVGTLFVVELTDKDALFLLTLATKSKASAVFAAGAIAFTITSAVIVVVGSALLSFVPVLWIKVAGGAIMLAYAAWELAHPSDEEAMEKKEGKLLGKGRAGWSILLPAIATLVILDLAGDATELVTVVFVARFKDLLLVFFGAVIGLVGAVALETALGNRLGRLLAPKRIRYLSAAVLLTIGTIIIVTSFIGF